FTARILSPCSLRADAPHPRLSAPPREGTSMHRSTTTPSRPPEVVAAAATALLAASGVVVAARAVQAAPLATIVINEVESSDTVPKDWVELKTSAPRRSTRAVNPRRRQRQPNEGHPGNIASGGH